MTEKSQRQPLKSFQVRCSNCNLSGLCLPRGLSGDEIDQLDTIVKRNKPLRKNDKLVNAGDDLTAIFAVRSGSFKSVFIDNDGEEHIMGFHLSGELIGLDALSDQKHQCAIVALETSSVCQLPYERLEYLCSRIPGLQHEMFSLMGREVRQEHDMLLTLSNQSAQARVASFLVGLSCRFKRRGYSATEFFLPMTRGEIALYLGLAIETVSRVLSKFQEDKLISVDRRMITLHESEILESMTETACPNNTEKQH